WLKQWHERLNAQRLFSLLVTAANNHVERFAFEPLERQKRDKPSSFERNGIDVQGTNDGRTRRRKLKKHLAFFTKSLEKLSSIRRRHRLRHLQTLQRNRCAKRRVIRLVHDAKPALGDDSIDAEKPGLGRTYDAKDVPVHSGYSNRGSRV